ncbi:MAG TPA: hypothetical protein VN541_01985 [Tepidisphaeraceae bacterium]|nr:hypothetical protein [Tepidisphaeraceae bacterium]
MPKGPPFNFTKRVEQLVSERQKHAAALQKIDQTLSGLRAALGLLGEEAGAGNGSHAAPAAAPPTRGPGRPRRRRGRQKFAVTGDDMILSLARQRGGVSTHDVKRRWADEGRGGTADNSLSRLVKVGRLKRNPIPGERGSRYTAV